MPHLTALQHAVLARQARGKSDELRLALTEPIAVVGMGCRFPGGAETPDAYWKLLRDGRDAVVEVPHDRWDIDALFDPDPAAPGKMATRWGGFLQGPVDGFDAAYFGLSPREVRKMDPQHRLFLEVAMEALEGAAVDPASLGGCRAGVVVASYYNDYAHLQMASPKGMDGHTSTGTAHSILANRLSYLLDLRGPSLSLDTACSSSLVAVHLACQSLRSDESDLVLAGGVSLMLIPEVTIALSKWGFLAPDGRCKTFDARANGFVRGEGCGVVVLKRLSDAIADGDPVLALLRGSAVNQDGRTSVMTAPSGIAQREVIQAALRSGDVDPLTISYVEAHGTGTSLGDPIEVEALGEALGGPHTAPPVVLGAAKTNLGHLEAAAGIAGLIKVVLALREERIPQNLHFSSLNPHITLEGTRFVLPNAPVPWPRSSSPRRAGVSSFGFGGTNAHIVLEEAPLLPADEAPVSRPAYVVTLSARSGPALRALAARHAEFLEGADDNVLPSYSFSTTAGRVHHPYRVSLVGSSPRPLAVTLREYADRGVAQGCVTGSAVSAPPALAFLCSGQGSQYAGMGKGLYASEELFRETVDACDAVFRPLLGESIRMVMFGDEGKGALIDRTLFTQPALFVLEYALGVLWQSWGVVPDAILGHSVGEYVAAALGGYLSRDEALRLIAERARLMDALPPGGAMAAVFAAPPTVRSALGSDAASVALAAENGPENSVISGEEAAVGRVIERLTASGVRSQRLTVSHAFHSPLMEPILEPFERAAAGTSFGRGTVPLISNVTGDVASLDLIGNGGYWRRHLRHTVRFADSVATLRRLGITAFLELGPHPVLLGMARRCVTDEEMYWLPSLRKGREDNGQMAETLGTLQAIGRKIDWESVAGDPAPRRIALPAYPFQRERYWLETDRQPAQVQLPGWNHPLAGGALPLAASRETVFSGRVTTTDAPYLQDHVIHGACVVPASALLEMAAAIARSRGALPSIGIRDLTLLSPLVVPEQGGTAVQTYLLPADDAGFSARLYGRTDDAGTTGAWMLHAEWRVPPSATPDSDQGILDIAGVRERLPLAIERDQFYARAAQEGAHFGPSFRLVSRVSMGKGETLAALDDMTHASGSDRYLMHPAVLDAALQPALALFFEGKEKGCGVLVPFAVEEIVFSAREGAARWSHLVQTANTVEGMSADLTVADANGDVLVRARGIRLRVVRPGDLEQRGDAGADPWTSQVRWERAEPIAHASPEDRYWLLCGGERAFGEAVAEAMNRGLPAPCAEYAPECEGSFTVAAIDVALHRFSSAQPDRPLSLVYLGGMVGQLLEGRESAAIAESSRQVLEPFLHMVHAAARAGRRLSVITVTRGAWRLGDERPVPVRSSLWGLAAVAASEFPEWDLRRIDADPFAAADDAVLLAAELRGGGHTPQVALRGGNRYLPRLRPLAHPDQSAPRELLPLPSGECYQLTTTERGRLENLTLRPRSRPSPGPGQVEIAVRAAGLNFRDVLNVLGLYPGDPGDPGNECAGVVTRVGKGTERWSVGDNVMAITDGCHGTHVLADAGLLAKKPPALSWGQAASVPIAFTTAVYALDECARVKAGDRVLIHAAAGGVGLAAVQVAFARGAEVIATAGSPEKVALLRALGVQHVFNSRSTSFADGVRACTNGRGVTVVLNSLTGDFIPATLDVVAPKGRFVEIGKIGIWEPDRVSRHRPDVDYRILYMGDLFTREPGTIGKMLDRIGADLQRGALTLPACQVFGAEEAVIAFRTMAQARHVGKIAISFGAASASRTTRDVPLFAGDASYLVTGGAGGIGLHLARWMVRHGAGTIVLVGRHAPSDTTEAELRRLSDGGSKVLFRVCDVEDGEAVDALIADLAASHPPLRGVFHAAGVVDDGVLTEMTWERVWKVMGPKAAGVWALHCATRGLALDSFVLFSSLACLAGWKGQGNYAAANAFLDAFAAWRRTCGLPGLSVNWSAWEDTGMTAAVSEADRQRFARSGLRGMPPDRALASLERLMRSPATNAAVADIDWENFLANGVESALASFWETAKGGRPAGNRPAGEPARADEPPLRARIEAAPASRRRAILRDYVERVVVRTLGLAPGTPVDPGQGLRGLGLDSLMSVELRNTLQKSLDAVLPSTLAFDHPTVNALVDHLGDTVLGLGEARSAPLQPEADDHKRLREMTDEEAEAELREELQRKK